MLAADPPAMPTGTEHGDLRAGSAPASRLGPRKDSAFSAALVQEPKHIL
jgi:hypothetical protein